ncbi:GNAT family N-acetyltransferase (plasmid) [Azospirillum oryzae]|uniref:GNAT family N-acetyltransferase n=1 Tax=Azospirillum oryzae TaxID=286727 RepID=A0A6N1AIJ0_9PROT|nr:GNAT family N-acetyltransferase [Azospirillum oryzae]KAA0588832.1 GNAT family N-acetyltransferase [Azospirillum oryzae]QKS50177.1 GNAT family N-acetyltransferase [Azospirillum oryzae]GLR80252.1 N-acetyltransferase [Azospirillum oryzae]
MADKSIQGESVQGQSGPIEYAVEPDLSADDFIDVLERSGLAERRPVGDRPRVEAMLRNAGLIVTARDQGRLVGVARSITDFVYCCYLSDLAVDRALQGRGIGKELMRRTRDAMGPGTMCLLLSAPKAISFYEQAGLKRHEQAFLFTDLE